MGMTIDEAIHDTEVMKEYLEYRDEVRSKGLGVLIDIARKYKKIKEQVDIAIDKENFAISGARLIQIREIINGNDD